MSNNTLISLRCDDCGTETERHIGTGKGAMSFWSLRRLMVTKGWKCTASRDYCAWCALNGRGKDKETLSHFTHQYN